MPGKTARELARLIFFAACVAGLAGPAWGISGWFEDGVVFLQDGKNEQAVEAFTRALQINPRLASAYNNRGIAWRSLGKFDKALADFTKAIEVDPELADAYTNRATIRYFQGLWGQAVEDCEKALTITPDNVWAANQLAWIFATCPDPGYRDGAKAESLARQLSAVHPEVQFLDTLAAALAEAGKYTEAASIQEKIVAATSGVLNPGDLAPYEKRLSLYRAHTPYRTPEKPSAGSASKKGKAEKSRPN